MLPFLRRRPAQTCGHVCLDVLWFRININVHWGVGTVSADYVDVEQKIERLPDAAAFPFVRGLVLALSWYGISVIHVPESRGERVV